MPKGYVIVHAEVTDPEKWAEYVAKSKVALDKYGGQPIVRGGSASRSRGRPPAQRRCSSSRATRPRSAMRKSPEYAEAKKLRQGAGSIDMVVVEGV